MYGGCLQLSLPDNVASKGMLGLCAIQPSLQTLLHACACAQLLASDMPGIDWGAMDNTGKALKSEVLLELVQVPIHAGTILYHSG